MGEAINEGLTGINDALDTGGGVAEIDEAFAASAACTALAE